jgi:tRNA pseudouridine55 synthase
MSYNGVLVIDKPAGVTSHDVVARVRRLTGERSIGHLGTLDPMATGLLPLVLGRMTRLAQFYGDSEKTYEGEIRFGFATDTYDADGDAVGETCVPQVTLEQLKDASLKFRGDLLQTPPPFSAKKIQGVPAYKLARKDQPVELKSVPVTVHELQIFDVTGDRASFRARVSAGTYIRCIAHELGRELGCGAHLSVLRRTHVAEFGPDSMKTFDDLESALASGSLEDLMVHPRNVLPALPSVNATEENAAWIRNGRSLNLPEFSSAPLVKVFSGQRELIAICNRIAGTLFHPKVVLMASNEAVLSRFE